LPKKVLDVTRLLPSREVFYLCSWYQDKGTDTHYQPSWVSSYILKDILKEHRLIVEFYQAQLPNYDRRQELSQN